MEKKKLIIIDSNSLIHRAYHALPPLTTKKGEAVGAVYGFLLVFLKAIKEFQPDFVVACFDVPGPTFRSKIYKEYKAKRPPAPEELYQQIPKVKEILKEFSVPVFEKEGFEADDIIGTIACLASKKQILPEVEEVKTSSPRFACAREIETVILSGDSDALQLVSSHTKVYLLRKGIKDTILYDQSLVKEKYQGLSAGQLVDFKGLRGDPSDNIPGAFGVGEKTATELIKNFGTIENLYQNLEGLKPKLKEVLIKNKEQVFLSKELAKIDKNVPIGLKLKECQWRSYNKEKAAQCLKNLEFFSLIERLPQQK